MKIQDLPEKLITYVSMTIVEYAALRETAIHSNNHTEAYTELHHTVVLFSRLSFLSLGA